MKVFTKNSLSQLTKTISLTIVTAAFSVAIAAQERRLEEVIVTAQKRAQSSQDIPVAVTAISSEGPKVPYLGKAPRPVC